jgi:hypothetical protein
VQSGTAFLRLQQSKEGRRENSGNFLCNAAAAQSIYFAVFLINYSAASARMSVVYCVRRKLALTARFRLPMIVQNR